MSKCTMHLRFNMPADYRAIVKNEYICLSLRWPWRPLFLRKAQTVNLLAKATVQGPPPPPTARWAGARCLQASGGL